MGSGIIRGGRGGRVANPWTVLGEILEGGIKKKGKGERKEEGEKRGKEKRENGEEKKGNRKSGGVKLKM